MSENIVEAIKKLAQKLGDEDADPETITEAIDVVTENVDKDSEGGYVLL